MVEEEEKANWTGQFYLTPPPPPLFMLLVRKTGGKKEKKAVDNWLSDIRAEKL